MLAPPRIEFAEHDGTHIAYQTSGRGPLDLVFVPGSVSTTLAWDSEVPSKWFRRMANFSRLVTYDQRGMGYSDPVEPSPVPSVDDLVADLEAVIATVGVRDPVLFGTHNGSAVAAAYAARRPVRSLVFCNGWARLERAEDYPIGLSARVLDELGERYQRDWGSGRIVDQFTRPQRNEATDRIELQSTSRAQAVTLYKLNRSIDIRHLLPSITAPTLVIHMEDNLMVPPAFGRYVAGAIPGARLAVLPGPDHLFLRNPVTPVIDEVELYVTGRISPYNDRMTTTILFTDIVDSTTLAASVGDEGWSKLIDEHNRRVQRVVQVQSGYEVKSTGDGFLVAFEHPADAVRCAFSAVDAVRDLGIELRSGIHVGDVARMGRRDLSGLAVHFAQRLCARAEAGQVLVSDAVRDAGSSSNIRFDECGTAALKGFPGEWEVFEARI